MLPSVGLHGRTRNAAALSLMLLGGYLLLAVACWALIKTAHAAIEPVTAFSGLINRLPSLEMATTWHLPVFLVLGWWLVALFLHGRIVQYTTGARSITRSQEPRIYNIVENTAIAVGLPMPTVDIVETPARNAYAAGLANDASTVTVTRGLLDALDDRELQAVVAHEIAHIRNGDARVMLIASVFNGFVTLVAGFLWRYVKTMHERGSEKNPVIILLFVVFGLSFIPAWVVFSIMGSIGLAVAATISRLREHVADADALAITKDPDAMISALEKIAGHERIDWLNVGMAGFMFAAPTENRWLSTHPNLSDRVAGIEVSRSKYPARLVRSPRRPAATAGRPAVAFGRRV